MISKLLISIRSDLKPLRNNLTDIDHQYMKLADKSNFFDKLVEKDKR